MTYPDYLHPVREGECASPRYRCALCRQPLEEVPARFGVALLPCTECQTQKLDPGLVLGIVGACALVVVLVVTFLGR